MKKTLLFIITAILLVIGLTSCSQYKGNINSENKDNFMILELDEFCGEYSVKVKRTISGEGTVYYQVNLTSGTLSSSFYENTVMGTQSLFTVEAGETVNGSFGYVEGNGEIEFTFEADAPVSGEVIIAFTEDALKAVHNDKFLHEHTIEWETTEETHKRIYVCCPEYTDIESSHCDDDNNGYCDECEYFVSIPCYEHSYDFIINEHTHQRIFTCGCPFEDIAEMHTNNESDNSCDVCGHEMLLRNQAGCEWMHEVSAEDIAEIKIISEPVGVASGAIKKISNSTDGATVPKLYEEYYWLDITPISKEQGEIDGGGAVTVKFVFKDRTEKELCFNNGNYRDANGNYFELLYTPKFEDEDEYTSSYGFITYTDEGTVYDHIGEAKKNALHHRQHR